MTQNNIVDPDKVSYGAVAARSGVAVTIAKSIRYGLVFLVQAFLMNLLAPDEFGVMKYVTIILGVINLVTVAGLNTAIIQKRDLGEDERAPLFVVNLLICLILTAITYGSAPIIAQLFNEAELLPLMRVGSSIILIGGISTVHRSIMQREFRYGALSAIEAASAAVSSAVSIILAFKGYGAWALCWSLVVFHFVSSVLCMIVGRRRTQSIPISIVTTLPLFWFGAGWTLHRFLEYVNANMPNLLIGRFFGSGALGAFTVAFEAVSIPQFGLGLILAPIALSALSRMQSDTKRMNDAYLKLLSFTSMAAAIFLIIIGLCASDIIRTITMLRPADGAWDETAVFMRYLAVLGLLYSWAGYSDLLWAARRKIGVQISWTAAMLLTTAAAIIIGAPHGPRGVCAALIIRAAIALPLLIIVINRVSNIPVVEYIKTLTPAMICAAAAAAVCVIINYLLTDIFPTHHTIRLITCAALSTIAYCVVMITLYRDKLIQIKQYFKRDLDQQAAA